MKRTISIVALSLILLSTITSSHAADDWTQQFPSPKPTARSAFGMAYAGDEKTVLFGGSGGPGPDYDDTWIYDLSTNIWTQQSPSTKPYPRHYHDMAFIGENRTLLFGGWDGSGFPPGTWIYDSGTSTWEEQNPDEKPQGRYDHAMAYIGADQVLLFGGWFGMLDTVTWVYDVSDSNWIQKVPANRPSGRAAHSMAYIGDDKVILYGGGHSNTNDETWVYDLSDNNWTQKFPTTKPTVMYGIDMAYIGGNRVLVYGGSHAGNGYCDTTWAYDLSENNWMIDTNTVQPTGRHRHELSETSMDGTSYLMLFGGTLPDTVSDETWTFGGGDYLEENRPVVAVIFPNGGETLYDSTNITWIATDPDPGDSVLLSVDLEYSDNGGSSWGTIATGETNDGTYSWDISGLSEGDQYLARITVTDTSGLLDSDISDSTFALSIIAPPYVTVTYPNGGETLNDSTNIIWVATDPNPGDSALLGVDLQYTDNGGGSWHTIATGESNDGKYPWDISGLSDGSVYLIQITATDTSGLFNNDTSDSTFTVNNQGSLDDHLIAYWSFDEGVDSIAHDSSSYANHGTVYGATWTDGIIGSALNFDGTGDYVHCGTTLTGTVLSSVTVTAWVNTIDTEAGIVFYDGSDGEYLLATTPQFSVKLSNNTWYTLPAASSIPINHWIFLAGVYNGAKDSLKIYINGDIDSARACPDLSLYDPIGDYYPFIGAACNRDGMPEGGLNSIIDEVCVYDIALNTTQIRYLYTISPAPVNDLAIALNDAQLTLLWSAVTTDTNNHRIQINQYRIYRDTLSFSETHAMILDSTSDIFYNDTTGVIGNTTIHFYYRVTAVSGSRESEPSTMAGEFDTDLGNGE